MYVIAWKSTATGQTGGGTYKFDRDAALKICKQSNRDWPSIVHYIKEVIL